MEQPSELFRVSSIILDVKNILKKGYMEMKKKKITWGFKKCTGSLHFTLLALAWNGLILWRVQRKGVLSRLLAFAFNAESFAIAIQVFFLFSFSALFLDGLLKAFKWTFYHKFSRNCLTKNWLIPWIH